MLIGDVGADSLDGGDGADTFGGAGADVMLGGLATTCWNGGTEAGHPDRR